MTAAIAAGRATVGLRIARLYGDVRLACWLTRGSRPTRSSSLSRNSMRWCGGIEMRYAPPTHTSGAEATRTGSPPSPPAFHTP